jgi:murein DD-endopeptidase MepM/ murein hydrolase activator NlpD
MKKLELFIPAKPFKITQKWGVENDYPASFGYTRHPGVDIAIDEDVQLEAMCDGTVTEVGYTETNGNYVRYRTDLVEAEGRAGFVEFVYAHASKQPSVKKGERVFPGKPLILQGNTGYSTGPHTHIGAYMFDVHGNRIKLDPATDHTFDWTNYLVDGYTANIWLFIKNIWSTFNKRNN